MDERFTDRSTSELRAVLAELLSRPRDDHPWRRDSRIGLLRAINAELARRGVGRRQVITKRNASTLD